MFILEVILVISVVILFKKVSQIQEKVQNLESNSRVPKKVVPNEQPVGMNEVPESVETQEISVNNSKQPEESGGLDVIGWLKDNWILKMGILMVLIGFGWFVSYAFVHNWIGPMGRLILGFIIGGLVVLFGDFRMKKSISQGGSFLVLGTAIILITVFAGRFIYEFFSPLVSLVIVFISAAYMVLAALRYNVKNLAISAVIVASIAPLFTNLPSDDSVGLFAYIIVVVLSAIWVMFHKNWREVGAVAVIMTLLYSLNAGLFSSVSNDNVMLSLGYILSLIFFVANIFSLIKYKDEKINNSDAIVAIANGILIILWTMSKAPEVLQSLFIAGWMILFAFGSAIVFKGTNNSKFFYMYSLIAVVFLGVATAMELEGKALTFAYIFESAIISILGYVVTSKRRIGHTLSLLLIGPAIMSLPSFASRSWREGIMHQDFAIILSMVIVTLAVGYFFYRLHKDQDSNYVSGISLNPHTLMIIIGSAFFYGLIWKTFGALTTSSMAILLSLATYTVIGIATYFFGKLNERNVYKYYGGTLLILVVARLLLVDVWNMELGLRIVTFISIGILFISTAFIGNSKEK